MNNYRKYMQTEESFLGPAAQTERREAAAFDRGARRFRSAEMVSLIKVVTGEGMGTTQSVFREVTRYIDPATGEVIATIDPYPGGIVTGRPTPGSPS